MTTETLRNSITFLLLQVLRGWIVARVDWVFQEVVLVVGPELAHIRIGLDDGVDIFPVFFLDFADVNVSDDVPKLVEAYRTANCIWNFGLLERLHEGVLVLDLAIDRLGRVIEHFAAEI